MSYLEPCQEIENAVYYNDKALRNRDHDKLHDISIDTIEEATEKENISKFDVDSLLVPRVFYSH